MKVIPQAIINSFLSDYASDSDLRSQYAEEVDLVVYHLEEDLKRIAEINKPRVRVISRKSYVATAGAPLTKKSTYLDRLINAGMRWCEFVLVDPDRYVMPFMASYQTLMSPGRKARLGLAKCGEIAYLVCRGASNYIASLILNDSVENQLQIAHGTTLSSPQGSRALLTGIRKAGYRITINLFAAPNEVRKKLDNWRKVNEGYYQVSDTDFLTKGNAWASNLDLYLEFADSFSIFWSSDSENFLEAPKRIFQRFEGELTFGDSKLREEFLQHLKSISGNDFSLML
jgi:predicted ABC-type ATPase